MSSDSDIIRRHRDQPDVTYSALRRSTQCRRTLKMSGKLRKRLYALSLLGFLALALRFGASSGIKQRNVLLTDSESGK